MIIKSPEKHLTDKEFYTLIKFFDLVIEKKRIDDNDDFPLSYFGLSSEENGTIFNNLYMSAEIPEITVDIKKDYEFDKQIEETKKRAKEKPEKEQKELLKIIRKIQSGKKVKMEEIATVSWIWYKVYDYIRFTPLEYKIPEKIEKIFRDEINKYLDKLINDKLILSKKNYYKFEAQKRVLIKLIEDDKKIALYGNNFIIKEKFDWDGVLVRIPDFCLIQTVYALQKLSYLQVLGVWQNSEYPKKTFDNNSPDYNKEPVKYLNVNLVLEEIFVNEINNQYKKNNPKNVIEGFDIKRGVLKFAGQEIELSKKGKETDAVLLMQTLLKEQTAEWKHNDEILADWGYHDEDQKDVPKNKVYFAGQKINNAVALKTQIEDFVECNTSKARINPKYRKIDE